MKQFSHAWLAFKAIERLEKAPLKTEDRRCATELIRWFWNYRDSVIKGAWYPDMVIKDMATSHVLKLAPATQGQTEFRGLPDSCLVTPLARNSPVYGRPYQQVDAGDNLPERCEALAHAVIDHTKMQNTEEKGSPISPTSNHIAALLFMLSHYLADAHVPLHCDGRKFSSAADIHAQMESDWDTEVRKHFKIDLLNERFFYDPDGYPLRTKTDYSQSFLKRVEDGLAVRALTTKYGGAENNNVRTYLLAVCQNSYALAYAFIPPAYNETNVTTSNWKTLPGRQVEFDQLSEVVFADAVDAIARVWLRVWARYLKWVES